MFNTVVSIVIIVGVFVVVAGVLIGIALVMEDRKLESADTEALHLSEACYDDDHDECDDIRCECWCHGDAYNSSPLTTELNETNMADAAVYAFWHRAGFLVDRYPGVFDSAESITQAIHRAEHPHLYRDDWYDTNRKDFSQWAVEQWTLIANHRREMGLAA